MKEEKNDTKNKGVYNMVIIRGKHWAFSIENKVTWKEMKKEPDDVPYFGKWQGEDEKNRNRMYMGYYCFPFVFRKVIPL